MSSLAVRDWFSAEIVTRVPSIEFFPSINIDENHKGRPALWSTLEFNSATETRVSLGSRACFREFGEVVIIVVGKSGLGYSPVVVAAELFRTAFFAVRESILIGAGPDTGNLVLDAFDPPNTDISESGNWFLASLSGSYSFDTVRGV